MVHKEEHDVCTVAVCIIANKRAEVTSNSEEIKPVTLTLS